MQQHLEQFAPSVKIDTDPYSHDGLHHGLLGQAITSLHMPDFKIIDRLADSKGVFAFNLTNCVLVAKDYIYGNMVSAHKRAIVSAYNQEKPLIMFIGQDNHFYKFSPAVVLQNSRPNERWGEVMLNFDISLGKRYHVD
jgi:hypothetical protein